MAISPLYIPFYNLMEIFLDKDSGLPLSGGVVTFYQDNQRTTLKPVFEITGTDPNYTFAELPNPMVLSSTGTFVDTFGNPIVVYAYPYDAAGVEERYYVTVVSSGAVPQETIPATPYIPGSGSSTNNLTNAENTISNPQFTEVLFVDNGPHAYSVTGASTVTAVAPNWDLITTGTGTVTVTREASISTVAPSNPIYALKIATTGITGTYKLRQRLTNSPRIYANEFVAAYFVASVTSASAVSVIMNFTPSSGTAYELINTSIAPGVGFVENATSTAITGTINTDNSDVGYVDVSLEISVDSTISVSSIQIAGVSSATEILAFSQEPAARELDHLFHYYKPQLDYKPIPSYLVGWDFPMNPAQFNGDTIASAAFNIGANKSQYIWDQTIAFQTVDQGLSVARTSAGALEITAALVTQAALIQYLDQAQARELLLGNMAVNVSAFATGGTAISVSLWYTLDANLPTVTAGTNNSIALTVDATGVPVTENGTWVQVARGDQGVAQATLTTSLADYMFSSWTTSGTGSTTATFFAIVVGTDAMTAADVVTFDSISLVKGDIGTRPAPRTYDQTLQECQRYYETSFAPGAVATATRENSIGVPMSPYFNSGGATVSAQANGFGYQYKTSKRVAPTLSFYSGSSTTVDRATAMLRSSSAGLVLSEFTFSTNFTALVGGAGTYGFTYTASGALAGPTSSSSAGNAGLFYQYVADSRMGIVN